MFDLSRIIKNLYFFKRDYKTALAYLWSFLYVKIYLGFIAFLNICLWLWARYIHTNIGREQMALHYSVDFGIDLYGPAVRIYLIPFLGLLVIAVNFLILLCLGRYNFPETKFISHILFIASLIVNFILLAAITSIFFINFR